MVRTRNCQRAPLGPLRNRCKLRRASTYGIAVGVLLVLAICWDSRPRDLIQDFLSWSWMLQHFPPPQGTGASYQAVVSARVSVAGPITFIRDAATIEVGQARTVVRLAYLQVPDLSDDRGYDSYNYLAKLTSGKWVYCYLVDEWAADAQIGICTLENGTDLAAAIIELGLGTNSDPSSNGWYDHLAQKDVLLRDYLVPNGLEYFYQLDPDLSP